MLEELTGNLVGFHTLSHLSFVLFNKYPIYRNNRILYGMLGFSDVITHFLIYFDRKSLFHLLWFFYHFYKLENLILRRNKIINVLEFLNYTYTYNTYYNNYLFGVFFYAFMKYHKLVW